MTMKTLFRLRASVRTIAFFVAAFSMAVPHLARGQVPAGQVGTSPAQLHTLKITVLSTMLVGELENEGIGEWGFSALLRLMGIAFW